MECKPDGGQRECEKQRVDEHTEVDPARDAVLLESDEPGGGANLRIVELEQVRSELERQLCAHQGKPAQEQVVRRNQPPRAVREGPEERLRLTCQIVRHVLYGASGDVRLN